MNGRIFANVNGGTRFRFNKEMLSGVDGAKKIDLMGTELSGVLQFDGIWMGKEKAGLNCSLKIAKVKVVEKRLDLERALSDSD